MLYNIIWEFVQYEIGVEKNIQKAIEWYIKAFENGYDDAKTPLNFLSVSLDKKVIFF